MNKNKILAWALVALLVAGMVLILSGNRKKMREQSSSVLAADTEVAVSVYEVTEESYPRTFSANGLCQAVSELDFVSGVSGRVVEIYVDKGQLVRKGDPLLKIDADLLESDYKASQVAYETLLNDVRRFERAYLSGGVTDQQLENIRTQLVAAESRLARSRKMLDEAVVRSPMAGTVNARFVEPGSLIAPNVPLFDIVNKQELKLVCNIPESRIKAIYRGMPVSLTSSSVPGKSFSGQVRHIGIKPDRGLNYPVEVYLDRDDELQIGMYLKARFGSERMHTGILVPRKAILGSAKAANVFLVKDGIAVLREVTLGEMIGDRVEVNGGLSAGDLVITAGMMNVSDGKAVKLAQMQAL